MSTKSHAALAGALLLVVCMATPAQVNDVRMVVIKGKDIGGTVLKRLGLPSHQYCWEQCLQDERCSGTRWGSIKATAAGQCQLMSGVLEIKPLHDLKTADGAKITVIASRKEAGPSPQSPPKRGT